MNNFKCYIESQEGFVCMEFSGRMDEDMILPDRSQLEGKHVLVDFEEVAFINSLGIRKWLMWIEKHPFKSLRFKNLPLNVVDQVNMVEGFLPEDSQVESFYVPYYCEGCELETHHHFEEGREFCWGIKVPTDEELRSKKCEECGSGIEPSVQEQKFFLFLMKTLQTYSMAA